MLDNEFDEILLSNISEVVDGSEVSIIRSKHGLSTGSKNVGELDQDTESLIVSGYLPDNKNDEEKFVEERVPNLVDDGRYQAEIIHGPDDRKRIHNTKKWPWSVHGHMRMLFPNGKTYIGTGTLVNKHHVLTAGHCVYSRKDGGWATRVSFEPARNDNQRPFGTHFANRLLSVKGWTNKGNSDWDYAMLVLSSDIGTKTGWKGIITGPDKILKSYRVNVSGYPGDKGGYQLWTHADAITAVARERIFYMIDTMGGQSGSGVWSSWKGHSGEKICAIHTTGSTSGNGATRISRPKFNNLVRWMSEY